ncbi:MAG: ankyrin repeat domain-containing protein [Moraxellaceae bacterium]|nr:MAG: ankyrin repeat domain-containing protein [Moraxellaceae bacterium]
MSIELLESLISEGGGDQVRELLSQQPALARQLTSQQVSPLMLAAYFGRPEIADIIALSMDDLTLHELSVLGRVNEVMQLLEKDATAVNSFSDDGFTPLGLACMFGQTEIARILIGHAADANLPSNNDFSVYPLHSACALTDTTLVKHLLDAGAQPNVRQGMGLTPLHSAAQSGNIEMIILLLEKGADTMLRMEGGKLPADLASDKGHSEIADILSN